MGELKLNEIEEEKEDLISLLPDGILVEFLARLPTTKDAIKTCILSKRWKHVWNSIPNLSFRYDADKHKLPDFFSVVHKTLTQCSTQLNLNKFKLHTPYDIQFEARLNAFVLYAIKRNVQVFSLRLFSECVLDRCDFQMFFLRSTQRLFFTASCFTRLILSGCVLNPSRAITWKNLNSLYLKEVKLDEDLIENILSGSPVLETLVLNNCYGYERIDITSKSVKKFVFSGHMSLEPMSSDEKYIININAPNILSLTIHDDLWLWKLRLLDVSSVVKANLDYTMSVFFDTTDEDEEEMLKELVLSLRHVKELKIGMCTSWVFSRLEAGGFVLPLNKEYIHIYSHLTEDDDLLELDD